MKEKRTGKVFLVGAGPGDPELITVKGMKLIQQAGAVVYDFLIDQRLLSFARKDAELICVGKSPSHHTMKQEEINRLLAEKAEEHPIVVRLKNGDPFVFGRGAEEAAYLAERNMPFEVVSGVSSAIAVPAAAGVPLTHRDYASSIAIITGHRRDDGEVTIVNADTLVFLMPVANLERIAEKLLEEGKSPETPCVLIEKGTLPGQKVVQGNLANIFKDSKAREIRPPAVFVVGEVVNLRNLLIPTSSQVSSE
jgi:uroporphyrinogen III methyltransferase/synthase